LKNNKPPLLIQLHPAAGRVNPGAANYHGRWRGPPTFNSGATPPSGKLSHTAPFIPDRSLTVGMCSSAFKSTFTSCAVPFWDRALRRGSLAQRCVRLRAQIQIKYATLEGIIVGAFAAFIGLVLCFGGVVLLFNLRGMTDKVAAFRNATRAAVGARTMQMGLMEESRLGTWFFRLIGGVLATCGLFFTIVGLISI
ncbi:hypothetical protein, partial [Streptomyces sp. NPDC058398]|uniref:hypothetical protein n=1 Tax=Streptomyces sp. NPDC058398 TaxID=3346479 RepID=UPI003653562C